MACRQCDDLLAPVRQERVARDHQAGDALLGDRRERGVDLVRRGCVEDLDVQADGARGLLQFAGLARGLGIVRVKQQRNGLCLREKVMQQGEALGPELGTEPADPGDIAAGRFRLSTRPYLRGSSLLVNTIGIVLVAALAASAGLLPPVATITATWR